MAEAKWKAPEPRHHAQDCDCFNCRMHNRTKWAMRVADALQQKDLVEAFYGRDQLMRTVDLTFRVHSFYRVSLLMGQYTRITEQIKAGKILPTDVVDILTKPKENK